MDDIAAKVQRFYAELWNKQNMAEAPKLLHTELEFRGSLGVASHGLPGFLDYVQMIHRGLANYQCLIQELVVEGHKAFAKMHFSGLHQAEFMGYPATGHTVAWQGAALFTFEQGKISKLWVLGDLASLEPQLR